MNVDLADMNNLKATYASLATIRLMGRWNDWETQGVRNKNHCSQCAKILEK